MTPPERPAQESPALTDVNRRARFPLWAKLGLLFGSLVGVFIASYEWYGFRVDEARSLRSHQEALVGLGKTLAVSVDGEALETIRLTRDMKHNPAYRETYEWLVQVTRMAGLRWAGILRRDEQGRYSYVIDGESTAPLPVGYPLFDVGDVHHRAWAGEPSFQADMEDEWGRWDSAFVPIYVGRDRSKDEGGRVVALMEVDYDADAKDLLRAARLQRLVIKTSLAFLLALAIAVGFARYLNRHLQRLTRTALHVASGDLEQSIKIQTQDEIGLLGGAFNTMVTGLKEREFIRDTFGRYVSEEVVSRVLTDPEGLKLGGAVRRVSIMMTDLRGFTSLSERLGPEAMVAMLNRYFTCMADVVMEYGGTLSEFTGDGMVIFFGAPTRQEDDALRAVACAVALQRALVGFNASEGRALEMGIGVDTGDVIAGNIGSSKRMKYGVVGDPINTAARLESFTVGTQVFISDATYEAVKGQVEVGRVKKVGAKGKKRAVSCYPLLSVGGGYDLQMPERERGGPAREVSLDTLCFAIEGKQVAQEGKPGRIVSLTESEARLECSWPVEVLSNLKLDIEVAGQRAENIYGKVLSVAPGSAGRAAVAELRFTSVPDSCKALLDAARLAGSPKSAS